MSKCYFCGSECIRLPKVGIGFGMYGFNFDFCEPCLTGMTADEFWKEIFLKQGYSYPPVLANPESWEDDGSPSELTLPTKKTKRKRSRQEIERSKMSNGLRYEIMKRDGWKCVLCGATSETTILVIDHIHPISKGGKTIEENLRTLCKECNYGKCAKIEVVT